MSALPSWLERQAAEAEELRELARRREPGARDRETQQHLDLWEAEQDEWWKDGAR